MGFFPQFPGFGGRTNVNQNVTVKKGADVGGLLGGTPMDDGQALSLGILQAMPALQQAGYERSASPVGSIAKNLIPLFGAMIYAKAAQQQAAEQNAEKNLAKYKLALETAKVQGDLAKQPGEMAKTKAETDRIDAEVKYRNALMSNPQIAAFLGGGGGGGDVGTSAASAPSSPEVDIKDNPAAQEFFRKTKEKYPGMSAEEMASLYDSAQGKTSGTPGNGTTGTAGMKPKVTMGITGPGISFSSDVASPERFAQQKLLAEIQSGLTQKNTQVAADIQLDKEKKFAEWKRQSPALTTQQQNALEAGSTLQGMLDEIPAAVKSVPAGMSRSEFARQAAKYQGRADHPIIANAVTGWTGGLINADTNPALDQYFATVGQTQAALSSFSLAGLKGGIRTLQWLQVHYPGWGDSPAEALRKSTWLNNNRGMVQQKLDYLNGLIHSSAQAADALGGEPVGDRVRVKIRNDKTGEEKFIMFDPTTNETSAE